MAANPKMVYLGTEHYVSGALVESIGRGAILKVEIDDSNLYPDEDWIEPMLNRADKNPSDPHRRDPKVREVLQEYRRFPRPEKNAWRKIPRRFAWSAQEYLKHLWKESLRFGAVGHLGPIPPEQILQVKIKGVREKLLSNPLPKTAS